MNTTNRIYTFTSVLHEANKAELPASYTSDTPTDKLITLTSNVNDLCWEITAGTKRTTPSTEIISADSIKRNATNIINICITELKNLGHTTEDAIELIATDGALWFWGLNSYPLDTLDQDTPAIYRIQSIYVATGCLTEWWPNKISPQVNVELNSKLIPAFTNLAYEATCAIIAHTH
jgi:hypothetical protein|nr:MAG TPA: hypothetical protein [Caudoviricetes sp.]